MYVLLLTAILTTIHASRDTAAAGCMGKAMYHA